MYKTIEELVDKIDERNTDGSVSELIGVSIDKCFIKSVANTNGTDLSKYKVIRKNDFAVSLMQVSRDSKIPVARLEEYDVAIISPAYPIFRVKDENLILPEYLDMWFKRSEFDREAAFIAVGGVRGSMPWEEFAKMKLPVPSIEEQRKVVQAYKTITDRIALKKRINDNLAAALSSMYKEFFTVGTPENLPAHWKIAPFSDIADVIMGQSPE
ncbi:restriction endonuclease subunit S, partial [Hominenteromicrobium sp.]|uniref:restriction endonuclease subunit S n=1 Tax=Hominenteromicrobium sp. TaxID=3073581 RepID=UPI003A929ECC